MKRGTPFIYQGEEFGMQNTGFTSIEEYNDVESINQYNEMIKNGHLKNMQWKLLITLVEIMQELQCNGIAQKIMASLLEFHG